MADDRGDSRVSSFLVGFLVGSLIAGGAATGYFFWKRRELAYQRKWLEVELIVSRASRDLAESDRNTREVLREAEERLKNLQEK